MMMPASGMMGYYFPWNFAGDYDTSSYNPMYSDNQVSSFEIDNLMNALRSCPDYKIPSPKIMWGALLGPIVIGLLIAIFVASGMVYLMGVAVFGGFAVAIVFICCGACELAALKARRKLQLDQVIAQQAQSVFTPKRAILRMSPHMGYIAIEFGWKSGQPGMMNMGMGMNTGMPGMGMGMNTGMPGMNMGMNPGQQGLYGQQNQFGMNQQQPFMGAKPPTMF